MKFSNNHLLMHLRVVKRKLYSLEILGSEYSRMGFYVRTCERSCEHSRVRFLEFLGDAAGSRRTCRQSKPASFEHNGPALRTNLKDFAKPPSVRCARVHAVEVNSVPADFSLRAQLEAGWRRPELRGSSRSATSPFSWEPLRSLLPPSRSVFLALHFVLPPSSSRDLLCFLPFPLPRAAGGPILARGRPATRTVEKMDKDQENQEGNREGGITNAQARGT